jgi:formamidopyrimidine-DNA glycosylase
MPELPEVETLARKLKPQLVEKTIVGARLRWPRTLAFPTARTFHEQIKGQVIQNVTRRAKYFILQLSDFSLLIHLRMSGDLQVKEGEIKPERHDRLILSLIHPESGLSQLVFNDTRKFGRVWLTTDPDEVLGNLGPEPLSRRFTPEWLYMALHNRHRLLKPLLLDQTFLAGLGNIYADESLHRAKLHPLASSDSVTAEQARALRESICTVLKEGIRRNGSSFDWVYRGGEYRFRVYDRTGEPCPVCGTNIERISVGQRSTHFCPSCQKPG